MNTIVEFIIHYRGKREAIMVLINRIAKFNYNDIEITIHFENNIARLRLIPFSDGLDYDCSIPVEHYTRILKKIFVHRQIEYSVIETIFNDLAIEVTAKIS